MSQVDNNSQASALAQLQNAINLGPTAGIQLTYAKLQLALAEFSKIAAQEQMKLIENAQAEQSEVSAMLNEMRQAQANAKSEDEATGVSWDIKNYMDKNGLAYDTAGNDWIHTDEEWDVAITSMQGHLEQLGTNTQQLMVLVNDYMGQYNSYLQGANTSISQSTQVLQAIARGQ